MTPATQIATDVLTRLRDPAAQMIANDSPPTTANGTLFLYAMMTVAQWYVNLAERLVVSTFSLALANNTLVYGMDNVGPLDYAGQILSLTDNNGNEVTRMSDAALGRTNRGWFKAVGTAIIGWGTIGKTLLFIFPGFASAAPTITFRYPILTPTLTSASNLAVPDDTTEDVARLTEMILRIKTRQLTGYDERLNDLEKTLGLKDTMSVTGGKAD